MIALALFACGGAPDGAVVAERIDLAERIGVDEAEVVGVTVEPVTGRVLLLDAWQGLFTIDGDLEVTPEQLTDPAFGDRRPYTDAAALGDGRFVFTVESDGLLFDPAVGQARQHFCYEPPMDGDWVETYQVTHGLAWSPDDQRIYAQPLTLEREGDGRVQSDFAQFEVETGTPRDWAIFEDVRFTAGAMAVAGHEVFLGSGDDVFAYALGAQPEKLFGLRELGVRRIEGMAVDPDTDRLWVVDGSDQELVGIDGWR
jgi:hypothetical protein